MMIFLANSLLSYMFIINNPDFELCRKFTQRHKSSILILEYPFFALMIDFYIYSLVVSQSQEANSFLLN